MEREHAGTVIVRARNGGTEQELTGLSFQVGRDQAILTPQGVFLIVSGTAYEFVAGTLRDPGQPLCSNAMPSALKILRLRHGFALYCNTVYDLAAQTHSSPGAVLDVAADGSVLLQRIACGPDAIKCFKFQLVLASESHKESVLGTFDSGGSNLLPLAEGLFTGDEVIALFDNHAGTGQVHVYRLGVGEKLSTHGGGGHLASAAGWSCFPKDGLEASTLFAERRSPSGLLSAAGVASENSTCEGIDENGTVVIQTLVDARGGHRYLSAAYGTEPILIGGSAGRAVPSAGDWYALAGDRLMRVRNRAPAPQDAGVDASLPDGDPMTVDAGSVIGSDGGHGIEGGTPVFPGSASADGSGVAIDTSGGYSADPAAPVSGTHERSACAVATLHRSYPALTPASLALAAATLALRTRRRRAD